jgi:hypothetical protein
MMSINSSVKWWAGLSTEIRDNIIRTMYEICHLTIDVEPIIEHRCKRLNDEIELLSTKLRNVENDKHIVMTEDILKTKLKIQSLESENTELLHKIREKEYMISNINKSDNDAIRELKDLILQTMHYKKQNSELGNDGEELIDSLIYEKYPDCEITDTSGYKNKADRLISFNDFSVLIESKNVKQETLNGCMKRYSEQITTDLIKEHNIRVGILASVRDVTFNGGDYFKVETVQTSSGTVCIIYCSNIKNQPFLLYSAIQLSRKLHHILSSECDNTSVLDAIRTSIPAINGILIGLNKNQTMIDALSESNKLVYTSLESTLKTLTKTTSVTHFTDHQQMVKDLYIALRNSNSGTTVTLKQLKLACDQRGIPHDTIKLVGGIKRLSNMTL